MIFRNSCYRCQYTTLQRVSDITLADFWGIEKYNFKGSTDAGVSMIITNTAQGMEAYRAVKDKTINKEFPVRYGVDSNYCLTNSTKKPSKTDEIIKEIATKGYESAAEKYFGCSRLKKVYWLIPPKMRSSIKKFRGH